MTKVGELIRESEWYPGEFYSGTKPEISIILPVFEKEDPVHLKECLNSLRWQTLKEIEIIIIDDASGEGTRKFIKDAMLEDGRISYIKHPKNIGLPAISTFEGYLKARADLIAFAFQDNVFYLGAFKLMLAYYKKYNQEQGIKFIYGSVDAQYTDLITKKTSFSKFGSQDFHKTSLLCNNYIGNAGVLVGKEVFEKYGWYDPHILMTRICDWDLWIRLSDFCEMKRVAVSVSLEKGQILESSIGNQRYLDRWAVNEWQSDSSRLEKLRVQNYLEYDVLDIPAYASPYLEKAVSEASYYFKDKSFNRKEIDEDKKIIVITEGITASETLVFKNLPDNLLGKILICELGSLQQSLIYFCSTVIISRNSIRDVGHLVEMCNFFNIPCYWYVDDNFTELGKEGHFPGDWSPATMRRLLKSFSGILTTTVSLQDYFFKYAFHDTVFLFPPIVSKNIISKKNDLTRKEKDKIFKFAYLGGAVRQTAFLQRVMPALKKLSQDYQIEVYIQGVDKNLISSYHTQKLKIITYPHDRNRDFVLHKLREIGIDFLLHPSGKTSNNQYKTLNVILNARELGALPLLNNTPPYSDEPSIRDIAIVCDDTKKSWFHELHAIINDPDRIKRIKDNIGDFCTKNFSGLLNVSVIEAILAASPPVNNSNIQKRINLFYDFSSNNYKFGYKSSLIKSSKIRQLILRHRMLYIFYSRLSQYRIVRFFIERSDSR